MSLAPDFYMSSTDLTGEWARTRACWLEKRMRGPHHEQYALLRIDPPGRPKGRSTPVDTVLVSPHHEGETLFPLSADPLAVYVYTAIREDSFAREEITGDEVRTEAWCELYSRRADAERAAAGA